MSTFDDRKQAYEGKFVHDQEMQFKVIARRNKRFGLWLAGQMGMDSAQAEDYALKMVLADMEKPEGFDLMQKALNDMQQAGKEVSETMLLSQLKEHYTEAHTHFYGDSQ